MRRAVIIPTLLFLLALPLSAGVVFKIETRVQEGSSSRSFESTIAAQGQKLSMSFAPGEASERGGKLHFDGEAREVKLQDDSKQSYMVFDEEAIRALGSTMSQAQQMMEQAMRNMPEAQRRQMEEMMKQRGMPGMPEMGAAAAAMDLEVEKTGETGERAGYPCVKYLMTRDGRTVRELWVTDWSNVEGGREIADTFRQMAEFFRQMMDSLSEAGGPGMASLPDSAFEFMDRIDGFPVVTRELDEGGALESETTLRSTERRSLDPSEFEPPAGYKRRAMLGG